jgi:hypothetical protein
MEMILMRTGRLTTTSTSMAIEIIILKKENMMNMDSSRQNKLLHQIIKELLEVGHTPEVVAEDVAIEDEATSHVTNVVAEDTWLEHVHHQLEALAVDEVLMFSEWQGTFADIATNLDIGRKIARLI